MVAVLLNSCGLLLLLNIGITATPPSLPPSSLQAFAEEVTNLQKQDVASEQLMEKLVQVESCCTQAC